MDENLTAAQIRLDQAREAIRAAELLGDNRLAHSSIERKPEFRNQPPIGGYPAGPRGSQTIGWVPRS
jgi:hypothetical protein